MSENVHRIFDAICVHEAEAMVDCTQDNHASKPAGVVR